MKKAFQTSWHYIRRSPYHSLVAVLVISLTFFIVSLLVLLAFGSMKILDHFEKRPQVIAFLKDEANKDEVDALSFRLLATGNIEEVKYVSKEEALEIYREQNKEDPLLLEMVSAEILPASIEISAKEIGYLEPMAELLNSELIVEEVSFQKDVVKVLEKLISGIKKAGLILISFLLVISLLEILVIVGMKASVRHREIKIMQLLGATAWHIRFPFLIEGFFYGMVGGFIAWGGICLLLVYLKPFLSSFLSGISLFPVSLGFMFLLWLALTFIGLLVGGLGSLLAVKRYLE